MIIIIWQLNNIMKPYGRVKTVKGGNNWKMDYHPKKGEHNWWETICCFLSRSRMKQIWKKDIEKEYNL